MLLQHPSLLITDDDSSFRETLRFVLERRGYRTLLAADGEEALEILKNSDVHLALLDMHMPKLTGLETMRRAKQLRSRLPCILLSARLDDALIQQARLAEAFSVLSKPISRDMLTTTVELAIRRTYEAPDEQGPPPQLPPQRRF
jgi:CheY-like chemotaxis protein